MFLVFRITNHFLPQNSKLVRNLNHRFRHAIISPNLCIENSSNAPLKSQFMNILLSGCEITSDKFMSKLSCFRKSKIQKKIWFFSRLVECNRKPASSVITKIWRKRRKLRKNVLESTFGDLKFDTTSSDGLLSNRLSMLVSTEGTNMTKSYRDVLNSTLEFKERSFENFLKATRQIMYTPYGRWIKEGWLDERAKNGTFIKVISYNILAQSLLEYHYELYQNHDVRYLSWQHRSSGLIQELKNFDADVLCFQEVEADKIDFFNTSLGSLGYRGVFKKRTHDKVDGCAIFYRENKFELREFVSVEYYQPNIHLLNRDNIGIVVRLSPKQNLDDNIVVATTHLLFNPKRHDIKLAQTQILLAEIDRVAYKATSYDDETSYYPVILTGDFNIRPHTLVYDLVVNGFVNDIQQCRRSYSYDYNERMSPARQQLIPTVLGITDDCQHHDLIRHRNSVRKGISDFKYVKLYNSERKSLSTNNSVENWRRSYIDYQKFGSGCLRHYLNLETVYPNDPTKPENATTFQNEWCTVDYIFYGPMQKYENSKIDGKLKLVSYLSLPNSSQSSHLQAIPNKFCPSDHLPLLATFHLPVRIKSSI